MAACDETFPLFYKNRPTPSLALQEKNTIMEKANSCFDLKKRANKHTAFFSVAWVRLCA